MQEITAQGSKHSPDTRQRAAVEYAVLGSISAVARSLNLPRQTVSGWASEDWWIQTVSEVRQRTADRHISLYQQLTTRALEHAHERLDECDAKAAAVIAAVSTDKARLLLNQPTRITESSANIEALAQRFAQLSREFDSRVVSTQHSAPEDDDNAGEG